MNNTKKFTRIMSLLLVVVMAVSAFALIDWSMLTKSVTEPTAGSSDFGTADDSTSDLAATRLKPQVIIPGAATASNYVAPTVSTSVGATHTLYRQSLSGKVDGVLDEAYYNGIHLQGSTNNSATGTTFDVYMVYGSDNLLHIYCEIHDKDIVANKDLYAFKAWHVESMDIYINKTETATNNIFHVIAPNSDNLAVPSGKWSPKAIYKSLTPTGWMFEATIGSDGANSTFSNGSSMKVGFYLNDPYNYTSTSSYSKTTVSNMASGTPNSDIASQTTLKFTIGTAPSQATNAKTVFGAIKTAKTAIVIPKDASYAVKADANNVKAALSNATVINEGTSLSGYTYVVYVGHVNSASITKSMVDTIGYQGYGVGVVGNAISVFGSTEEMLNAAVNVFKKEVSGSLTAKPLYSGTCEEWVGGEDIPYLPGATLVSDSGYGVYAIGKKGADAEHFATYKKGLEAMGYTKVQETSKGNFKSATYKNSDNIVTVNYGQYFKNSLSYNTAGDINTTVYGMMVMVNDADSYATDALNSSNLTYPTTYQPILSLYNRNQIIRLANGEFLIIDSSNQGGTDTANIISELIALSPNGKPVVAAWYFSHFHQDHIGGFATLAKSNKFESIQVKSVIFNFCSEQVVDTASDGDINSNMSVWIDCLENVQAAGGKIYYSHAGQTFHFPGAKLEVLRTYEDIMPFRFDVGTNGTGRSNPTNQIAKVTVYKGSGSSQTIMFCGDSSVEEFSLDTIRYGSYLKSDIVQLAHHGGGDYDAYKSASGTTGYTKANAFYNTYVKAKYAIVAKVGSRSCSPAEAAAVSAATETFYTNTAADNTVSQITRVPLPYSGTAATLSITPTLGTFDTTIYDKSATGSTNSDNGITANPNASAITAPSGVTEESRFVYTANTVYTNITTDGVMDPAYTYGIHLKSNKTNNATQDGKYPISFEAYIVGGQDGKIHVYATVYDSARHVGAYSQNWRQDCFDFWFYNFNPAGEQTGNVRFAAKQSTKVGDTATQKTCNFDIPTQFQDFYVVNSSTQYSVEFSFNNNGTAFKDGDQIAFGCYINSIDTHSGYGTDQHTNHCAMVDTGWSVARNYYMNPNNGYQKFSNLLTFSTESATKTAGASDRTSGADALLPVNPGYDTVQESVSNRGKNNSLPKLDTNLGGNTIQNVYGTNIAYAVPTLDGEMDNIYTYGLHLEDKYGGGLYQYSKQYQDLQIDVYMIFSENGRIYTFIKVVDKFITNKPSTQWHRDGIDFYYDFGNDGGGWNSWNFGFEATQPTTRQPNKDYKIKQQSYGYTVEFYFDNNGKAFKMGDEFGFGIFYNNCIAFADNSAANTMSWSKNADGSVTFGSTSYSKDTVMVGSYMSDMIGGYLSPQQGGQANSADAIKLISNNAMAGYFFDYGDGSAKYPYEINDKADFDRYVNTVLGDYGRLDLSAKLNTDITLNTGLTSGGYVNAGTFTKWTPIGTSAKPFTGTIDGNGKTIKGLYIDGTTDYAGFIAYNKGTIKNLKFADSYVKGNNYVGGIAGRNEGTLTNCAYNGTVIGKTNVGTDKAGYASTVYEVSFKSTGSYDYGWVYFVPSGTKLTNFEFMQFTGTAVPETITKNYANTPINAVITSAQAALGEDISIIFTVYLGTGNDNAFMRFTLAGEEKTAQAVSIGNGYYTFTFKGVSPEYMGDTLLAELVNGSTVIAKVSTFTFENYAKDLIAKTDAELIALGIASNKTAALRTLLKDMLVYGGEAQKYFGYNTSDLVSSGITGSSFTKPTSTDKNVGTSTSATTKFSGATLNISYDNRVRFDFVSTEVAKVTVKITIGGEDTMYVYGQNIIPNEDGSYSIYTPSLLATECDEVITATLYVDGVEVQTVTYSVKSYVYSMYANAKAGAIVKALYNYILAAEAYVK